MYKFVLNNNNYNDYYYVETNTFNIIQIDNLKNTL